MRAVLPPGFRVLGPIYECILTIRGDKLTCERRGKHRRNCRINGRFASSRQYYRRIWGRARG